MQAEAALDQVCRGVDPRERGLALELTMGVLRWRSRLDDLLSRMARQPLARLHPSVLDILRLGLYQLRHLTRVPVRAIVHESVELCRLADVPWATGLVNGVLRRYDREREALDALPSGRRTDALAVRYAHPPWLVRALERVSAKDLEPWLQANNEVPPLTLRANRARIDRAGLIDRFREAGLEVRETAYSPDGVVLESGGLITALPGFEQGLFAVQDEASQLVALLLGVQSGERVLDACAAPGGKAAHLAVLLGEAGRVIATDRSSERLKSVEETGARLVPGRIQTGVQDWGLEVSAKAAALLEGPIDRALVDAPCSGFGVLRRIPEIKWRRSIEEVRRYPARQLAILEAVAPHIRPGGTLVYSVCTPLLDEGPGVVQRFLEARPDFRHVDLRDELDPAFHPLLTGEGDLRTLPHRDRCDAFFAARFERRSV